MGKMKHWVNTACNIIITMTLALIVGCAAEVIRYPATLKNNDSTTSIEVKTVKEDASVTFNSGYTRVIRRSSLWRFVGKVAEGKVYVSADSVFSVEGAQVHEAYLVVNAGNLVGFYLPVEKSFAPLKTDHVVKLWEE